MEVIIMGGDGFCGWPTALHLADRELAKGQAAHHVTIVDNLSRQKIDQELGTESLTPIRSMPERQETWEEVAGSNKAIDFVELDIAADYDGLENLLTDINPDTIIHFAEQRSAPYSMKNSATARYTIRNNSEATTNILVAMAHNKLKAHLVHLGTMGVYGYGRTGELPIPEGYLTVQLTGPDGKYIPMEIVHPDYAGSVYHETKAVDHSWFQAFHRMYDLPITDLHQGIVWGTQTEQTRKNEGLIGRFDWDGDFGTVLNRFLVQAAIGYPLQVHGKGGQTRAFINIQDTVRCVELAVLNPPEPSEKPRIFNQTTEQKQVLDLAKTVIDLVPGSSYELVPNPRREAEANDLIVVNKTLIELGLNPTTIQDGLLDEVVDIAQKYADRIDRSKIPATSKWRND